RGNRCAGHSVRQSVRNAPPQCVGRPRLPSALGSGPVRLLSENPRHRLPRPCAPARPMPCSPCRPSSSVSPIVGFGDLDGNHTVAVTVNRPPLDFYTPLWTLPPRIGRKASRVF